MSMLKKLGTKLLSLLMTFLLVTGTILIPVSAAVGTAVIPNGVQFEDTNGEPVNAHGGGILQVGEYYYWYGEHRDSTVGWLFEGVSCYRTTDFIHWEYRGDVLTKYSATELNTCNIERPKVIYNASTGQYVMWMHWENGSDYGQARCAVAYSNTPDGNFTYVDSFRPYEDQGVIDPGSNPAILGYMSRDCTLFVDSDGTAYFISAANENADLNVYRLTPDYLDIDELVVVLWPSQKREAPCLFKRGNYYFMLTSGCTGWEPNQAKYAYSTSITSGWSSLINIADSTTYYSQPAYVTTLTGTSGTSYLYMGDRWAGAWGGWVNDSRYVWAPLVFPTNTSMTMSYYNALSVDTATATIASSNEIMAVNDYTTGTSNNKFNYVGTWSSGSQEGAYNNDNHWSSVTDSYYEVAFYGTQVKIYGCTDKINGIAAVSIDNGTETLVDTYNSHRADSMLLYASPQLPIGQHTVKVRVTGTKNASSTGNCIVADRVDVYGNVTVTLPGSFSLVSPSNSARNIAYTSTAFDWADSSSATSYQIIVDNNSTFSSPEVNVSGLTNSNYTSSVTFNRNTTYYWKVIAYNSTGSTQCASVFTFSTKRQ